MDINDTIRNKNLLRVAMEIAAKVLEKEMIKELPKLKLLLHQKMKLQ